jgi:hypothetical protein
MHGIVAKSGIIFASGAINRPAFDTGQFYAYLHRIGFRCIEGETETRDGTTG